MFKIVFLILISLCLCFSKKSFFNNECDHFFQIPNEPEWKKLKLKCSTLETSYSADNNGQISIFGVSSYYNFFKTNETSEYCILALYQSFYANPAYSNNKMAKILRRDYNNDVYFFQSAFSIKNEIITDKKILPREDNIINLVFSSPKNEIKKANLTSQYQTKKNFDFGFIKDIALSLSTNLDSISGKASSKDGAKFKYGSENMKNSIEKHEYQEWEVVELSTPMNGVYVNSTSEWMYHQAYTYDGFTDRAYNKRSWFEDKAVKDFNEDNVDTNMHGKELPEQSFSNLVGNTMSVWFIPSTYKKINLWHTFDHILGKQHYGSHYASHNHLEEHTHTVFDKVEVDLERGTFSVVSDQYNTTYVSKG